MRHLLFAILMATSTLAMAEPATTPAPGEQPKKVIALFDELIKNCGIDSCKATILDKDPFTGLLRYKYLAIPFSSIQNKYSDNADEFVEHIRQAFEEDKENCYLLHHILPNGHETLELKANDGYAVIRSKGDDAEVWLLCVRNEVYPNLRDAYAINFNNRNNEVDGIIFKITSPIEDDKQVPPDDVVADTIPADDVADDRKFPHVSPLDGTIWYNTYTSRAINNQLKLIEIYDKEIDYLKHNTHPYDVDSQDVKKRIKQLHKQAMKAQKKVDKLMNEL